MDYFLMSSVKYIFSWIFLYNAGDIYSLCDIIHMKLLM